MSHIFVTGTVVPGYGIASETATKIQVLPSNVYPDRSIIVDKTVHRQFPYFIDAGIPDIEKMHHGTINVDIAPQSFSIVAPDYEVSCEWIDGVRETFWLTKLRVEYKDIEVSGYLYYPCVSDQHVARNSMIEIIAERVPGVAYDETIRLHLPSNVTLE